MGFKPRHLITTLACFALLAICQNASAQTVASSFDPCNQFAKHSAGADISSATDTQLVALQAGVPVYVCGVHVNQAGGVGTVYLESATATSCGGTLTQLTGKWTANTAAGTTTDSTYMNASGTAIYVPVGDALCVKSTGTIVQSVTVSYVQQ